MGGSLLLQQFNNVQRTTWSAITRSFVITYTFDLISEDVIFLSESRNTFITFFFQ